MKKVIEQARAAVESIDAAIDLYQEHEAFFDSLEGFTPGIRPEGITFWCSGDIRERAKRLTTTFDIIFTRKRVTEQCYDWVSEINGVPIILNMVEHTGTDLTGSTVEL